MVGFGSARAGFVLAGILMAGTALVAPAHAASYLVDTDLGTINGIGSGGTLNGTQFVVQQSAGVTQFIFNGDLNIGTFDSVTGTGSNFASFKALNNANIAPGAIFNFSGSGASAGAGGGLGGTGQLGGSAGLGAFGGPGRVSQRQCCRGRGRRRFRPVQQSPRQSWHRR